MDLEKYDLDEEDVATLIAFLRVGLGGLLFVTPTRGAAAAWTAEGSGLPVARMGAKGTGARDIALGLGTLLAVQGDGPVRGWLEASALVDLLDGISIALSFRRLPKIKSALLIAMSLGSAMLQLQVASTIDA